MPWFDFGSNWQAFSARRLDAVRLTAAVRSLQSLLEKDTLEGLSFLDVGCGTGLFSIAAYQLGAAKVVGIDVNPSCIYVSVQNRDRLAPHAPILFQQGSALSGENLHSLGRFNIVYAWGSLHHTGAMWEAIRNVAKQVLPGGLLVLAIYNRHLTSPVWKSIKRLYNRLPGFGKVSMAVLFSGIIYVAKFLVTGRNPLEKERGMDFWFDVVDWIGGYPYEYTNPLEVEKFVTAQGFMPGHYIPAKVPTGCNEFVFIKNDCPIPGGCAGTPCQH
jgi:2-polyprenyl-6-hydroxyphenyl methylase/3-demethylubiquinone-9 3-methyltransferase